ncbi:MAG: hypothetical protein ACD_24C00464G0001 [uncultured bacterium]|uniref:Uncharacterized protein n=1 Tax=candidate division WWE3 bacterium RIFCSPLOWO2_01_FULL_37_15 TaxID=1802622 RepID=A0A1F4UTH4_UNCKA|nr:MAG: hypothetical protein ACD_24C00464G0001 [uncultured bacterium]OGC48202.1 MAG: hypothetical protein A3A69_02810 [candidate division WWE3 bacterium RIFCSPLOWO2_01_FULL_37_15]
MSRKNRSAEKKLRRELEALKAQLKSNTRTNTLQQLSPSPKDSPPSNSDKKTSNNYELSIGSIKRDLVKTFLFAVFAFFVIVALKIKGI